jgi:protein TonB
LGVEHSWIKCGLAALAIHAVILALPVSETVHQVAGQRTIDVEIMRQEAPKIPPPRTIERPKPPPKRPVLRQIVPRVSPRVPSPQVPRTVEKKEDPPSAGAGNVLDEDIVSQAAPSQAGAEGVAIAGVNVGGGTVGPGSGGTGKGSGAGGKGVGAGTGEGGGGGPVDARFGKADGPQIVYQASPEYPFEARRRQEEGKVALSLTIDEKGNLRNVRVIEATNETFAASAVDAMKRSRFRPARRKGVPVACRAPYTIRFGF